MWKSRFVLQQIVKRDMFYIDNYVQYIHIQSYYSIMYIFISIMSSIKSMNNKKDWKKISQNFNSNYLFYHSLAVQTINNFPAIQETSVQSLDWKISPGLENGNPLQYSCLENPMDRGAWWTTVHGVSKSQI